MAQGAPDLWRVRRPGSTRTQPPTIGNPKPLEQVLCVVTVPDEVDKLERWVDGSDVGGNGVCGGGGILELESDELR